MNTGQRGGAEGAEKGSMFLKQLDNLFGLGPLPKRHGNYWRGRRGRGEREGDRWRGKVVVEGLRRGNGGRWGEEKGRRLESQDLRLFWLDGSQMFAGPPSPLLPLGVALLWWIHRSPVSHAGQMGQWLCGDGPPEDQGKWEARGILLSRQPQARGGRPGYVFLSSSYPRHSQMTTDVCDCVQMCVTDFFCIYLYELIFNGNDHKLLEQLGVNE